MELIAVDLFSGCGGLTEGMHQAGFCTKIAIELNKTASTVYKLNHPKTTVITKDIKQISSEEIDSYIKGEVVHLLAGCPPCQGFSSIRRLNKAQPVEDDRNSLIMEYIRFVRILRPYTIMLENVPGLIHYDLFKKAVNILKKELGYKIEYKIVNVKDYDVPQNRKRLVLVGSRLGEISISNQILPKVTVRNKLFHLKQPELSDDYLHKVYQKNSKKILEKIALIPQDGGSRHDLPESYQLNCHKKNNVGFNDVYGRLKWDELSSTITGGCLNPSKGRFLHPEENRGISAREASLLQSFPENYVFPANIGKTQLALMIGNALPPKFSYYQSLNIKEHLKGYFSK